jgi:hypothetical protein
VELSDVAGAEELRYQVENRTNGAVRSGGVLGLVVIDKLLETNWKRSASIRRGRGSWLARRTEKLGFSYVQRNNGIGTFYLRGTEGDQPRSLADRRLLQEAQQGRNRQMLWLAITVRRVLHKQWVSER